MSKGFNDDFVIKYQKMQEAMRPIIESITIQTAPMIKTISDISYKYTKVISTYAELYKEVEPQIVSYFERLREFEKSRKFKIKEMAEMGWFPNWTTLKELPNEKALTYDIDAFMVANIEIHLDEIENTICELCSNRSSLIKEIFSLHKQGSYISSVPLFIIQADGICNERSSNFFSKSGKSKLTAPDEIVKEIEEGKITINFFYESLLEPLRVQRNIDRRSKDAGKRKHKNSAPNRHGIIHGSRKHLDYATKINSYKSLSFLAYIAFLIKGGVFDESTKDDDVFTGFS